MYNLQYTAERKLQRQKWNISGAFALIPHEMLHSKSAYTLPNLDYSQKVVFFHIHKIRRFAPEQKNTHLPRTHIEMLDGRRYNTLQTRHSTELMHTHEIIKTHPASENNREEEIINSIHRSSS